MARWLHWGSSRRRSVWRALLGLMFGVARWNGGRVLGPLGAVYVEFVRSTSPLVQILFWYFSASYIMPGPLLEPQQAIGFEFGAAAFALGVYHGAFLAEVLRSGLQSIPAGQLRSAITRSELLPGLRIRHRSTGSTRYRAPADERSRQPHQKHLSGARDWRHRNDVSGTLYRVYTFRAVEALTAATVLYLVLCLTVTAIGHALEVRLSLERDRHELLPSLN